MIADPETLPPPGKEPGDGDDAGDPVDLSTGQFVLTHTDLYLPDVLPIRVERTYRPQDPASRAFGRGGFLSYDLLLAGDFDYYSYIILGLPDGGRVRFERTEPGTSYDTTFVHTATPSEFYQARLTWNGNGWDLRLRDGTTYVFPDSDGDTDPYRAAVTSIRDRNGNTLAISRDPATGRITAITSPSGRWARALYDASGRVTRWSDNSGRQVNYTYDAAGRLWKVTDVAGGVTEYGYDAADRMATIKDPRGITYLTNEYDAQDRVSQQTLANGGTYEFSYVVGAGGSIVQTDVTNPRGFVRRATFNADGYRTSDTEALGTPVQQTLTIERQPSTNLVLSTTDALGRRSEYSYDVSGNLLSATRLAGTPNAVTTTMTYGVYSQVATVTDPMSHTTAFEYDSKGNRTSVTDASGHVTSLAYGADGVATSVTSAEGDTSTFAYEAGVLTQAIDPLGNTRTRSLDAIGRVRQTMSALGAVTKFEYDARGNRTLLTDPLGSTTAETYDEDGNLLTVTDARGSTTTFGYDAMNRRNIRTDGLLRSESAEYDQMGNIIQATDRKGQVTTFSYDALNRRVFAGFGTAGGGTSYARTVTYAYDQGDRLVQVTDSVNGSTTRSYDGLDRLLSEATQYGSLTYTYNADGLRTTMSVVGQPTTGYTFDASHRLTQVVRESQSVSFAYDQANRRTLVTLPNGIAIRAAYDPASRLTSLVYEKGTTTLGDLGYRYDAAGRVTGTSGSFARLVLSAPVTAATYDANNQISTWNGVAVTHDANGNLLSDGVSSYNWDARDRLVAVAGPASTASFDYDGEGRRTSKAAGAVTTNFVYDGLTAVQELQAGLLSANLLTGAGFDETFSREDASGTRTVLTDALGSTTGVADSAGDVTTEYSYSPFGSTTATGSPDPLSGQFTGRDNDGGDLYFMRARYYHARFQRFVSEDPLGFDGGDVNLYAYAFNSPTNYIDPLGLSGLLFCRNLGEIKLYDSAGKEIGSYDAANNPDSRSNGQWPDGSYNYERPTTHAGDAPNSEYGSFGNLIFTVPSRSDMGIHSGRQDKPDGRGRKGPEHATLGCIRTTDEGMKAITDLNKKDPLEDLVVDSECN
jgi:RHS repeat-associated protein